MNLQKMLRPRYEKDLPNKLRAFNSFLGKNKFFAGENVSDFTFQFNLTYTVAAMQTL